MKTMQTDRQGFALATAVLALVVVGALVTGGFYAASQESDVSRSTQHGMQAFFAAEHGLQTVVGTWKKADYDAIAIGESAEEKYTLTETGAREVYALVSVRRLTSMTAFVTSDGVVEIHGDTVALRRTGTLVRSREIAFPTNSALQARGDVTLKGNAEIHGEDKTPADWGGTCTAGGDKAGVTIPPGDTVIQGGSTELTGSPAVDTSYALNDSTTLLTYGGYTYEDLAEMADHTFDISEDPNLNADIQPSEKNGFCLVTDSLNWGDENHDSGGACTDHYPIIHAKGTADETLTLSGNGSGQGILLVDGNLKITGTFNYSGIIVVKGKLKVTGTGGESKLNGVVLVNSAYVDKNEDSSTTKGNAVVQFSSCVVQSVIDDNSSVYPIDHRSWSDLSAAVTS